jgi:hypothetical protein
MRIAAYLLVITVSYAAGLFTPHTGVTQSQPAQTAQATNGAFRDGLYLGQRDVSSGIPAHPSIGRWSSAADRAAFLAGYQQGYHRNQ